jgi:hypothetical protein
MQDSIHLSLRWGSLLLLALGPGRWALLRDASRLPGRDALALVAIGFTPVARKAILALTPSSARVGTLACRRGARRGRERTTLNSASYSLL